jgi:hypothetical protein
MAYPPYPPYPPERFEGDGVKAICGAGGRYDVDCRGAAESLPVGRGGRPRRGWPGGILNVYWQRCDGTSLGQIERWRWVENVTFGRLNLGPDISDATIRRYDLRGHPDEPGEGEVVIASCLAQLELDNNTKYDE